MCKTIERPPVISTRFVANIFWLGKNPMIKNKAYKMKLASSRGLVELSDIINIMDADSFTQNMKDVTENVCKNQLDVNDIAKCVIEAKKPVAFDLIADFESTARFVIIDNYEIAGGGIIVASEDSGVNSFEERVRIRNKMKVGGFITGDEIEKRYNHKPKFILFSGSSQAENDIYAKTLERKLFDMNYHTHYIGYSGLSNGLDADLKDDLFDRVEQVRRLGELARMFTDAGFIFITSINDIDDYDLATLKILNSPNEIFTVNIGGKEDASDIIIDEKEDVGKATDKIVESLFRRKILIDYFI
jgi:bifunctional enzyme CysN/CysC